MSDEFQEPQEQEHGAPPAPPQPSLMDYAGHAPADANPASEALAKEPYSDEEIAQVTAAITGFGLPLDSLDDYSKRYIQRTLPIFALLETGDALAELGIHKGGGIGRAPAWMRCAAAGAGMAMITFGLRKEIQREASAARAAGAGSVHDDEPGQGSHA